MANDNETLAKFDAAIVPDTLAAKRGVTPLCMCKRTYKSTVTRSLARTYGRMVNSTTEEKEDLRCITSAISLILQTSETFGFQIDVCRDFSLVEQWFSLFRFLQKKMASPMNWAKLVKYKTVAFYSVEKGVELPKELFPDFLDNPKFLLGGRWLRWYRLFRLNACELCLNSFLCSILQGVKRGCESVSEEALVAASRETFLKLTTKPKVPEKVYIDLRSNRVVVTPEDVIIEIKRTVNELFEKNSFSPRDYDLTGIPSTSASFEKSRSQMGSFGEVLDYMRLSDQRFGKADYFDEYSFVCQGKARRWDEEAIWFCDGGLDEDRVQSFDCTLRSENAYDIESCCPGHQGRFVEKNVIVYEHKKMQRLTEDLLFYNHFCTDRRVKIVPLAEALKVRVITKGPALASYLMMPFQRYLHGVLRRHPVTQLIGEPISEKILESRLGPLYPNEKWLSGDYQDATNGMFSYISDAIADAILLRILTGFDPLTRTYLVQCFKDLLTGHLIENPDKPGEFLPQRNGQLMGSVLSFPVLCIANVVLCRMAYQIGHQGQRVDLFRIPLLVNGDDCVFPATLDVELSWRVLCHLFGMLPSVGKVYFSRDFLNINSTTFLYRPNFACLQRGEYFWSKPRVTMTVDANTGEPKKVSFEKHFVRIYHINWGLIMLRKRSGAQLEKEDMFSQFSNISSYSKDLLETVPSRQAYSLYELFIRNYGSFAAENKIRLPWYVPRCFGGVGIYPFAHWGPSPKDQSIVNMMRNKEIFRVNGKDMVWKFHALYNKEFELVDKELQTSDEKAYRDFNQIYMLVYRNSPDLFFDSSPRNTGIQQLRKAERTWRRYLHRLKYLSSCDMWSMDDDPSFICVERIAEP